jgi:hypothetical protein
VVRKNHGSSILLSSPRTSQPTSDRILPFFEKHQAENTKKRVDFAEISEESFLMMEKGDHLKPDGLEKIRQIQSRA